MVSKNEKKIIRSLKLKKYRKQEGMFVAEGIKVINEFLNTKLILKKILVIESELHQFPNININCIEFITESELKQLTFLNSPQKALAIFEIPASLPYSSLEKKELKIALDSINDPGNLGTIIRLCDWFGINTLICSLNTVDCYNPKVVQATMGSLTRVNIVYTDLSNYLKQTELPILGTFLKGKNIYQTSLPQHGVLVMGNEANGISSEIESFISEKISIPQFGNTQKTESLNVATATAILLSELKRPFS